MRRSSIVALLIAIALPGCGYKGPLYLPKNEPAKPAAAERPTAEKPVNQQDNKQ